MINTFKYVDCGSSVFHCDCTGHRSYVEFEDERSFDISGNLLLPMVVAPAAVAMVWKWLFNSEFGLLNHILNSIGLKSVHWLSDPNIAIYSIAVVGIWGVIGYNMVLFLAGLQEIPRDYYEAAEIDGANAFQQFLRLRFL